LRGDALQHQRQRHVLLSRQLRQQLAELEHDPNRLRRSVLSLFSPRLSMRSPRSSTWPPSGRMIPARGCSRVTCRTPTGPSSPVCRARGPLRPRRPGQWWMGTF
jgi:hypothetical protein